jgi:hypothetical protein
LVKQAVCRVKQTARLKRAGARVRDLGWLAGLVALALGALPGSARALVDEPAFERFMQVSRPICARQPASACVALAWGFADSDGDEALSVAELATIRAELEGWALRHRERLTQPELASLALGLLLVDSLGLEHLHALYDSDADGLLSRTELLADLRLDQRPLPETLLDPAALDRRAIARRLGVPAALLDRLAP